MADITVAAYDGTTDSGNVQQRAYNAVIPSSSGLLGTGVAMTAAQTIEIDVEYNDKVIIFLEDTSGGANTFTVDGGDYPTSPLADKGSAAIAMVASDVIAVILEPGRFLQSNGKITATMSAAGRVWAFTAPPGFVGVVRMNP